MMNEAQNHQQDHLVEKAIAITPHDAMVTDIRDVKASTYSESDDESPGNSSDELANSSEGYVGSAKGKKIASESKHQKRRRCIMALSFIPLLAASTALAGFVLKGQKSNGSADSPPNDGEASASTTGEVEVSAGQGAGSVNPTLRPIPA